MSKQNRVEFDVAQLSEESRFLFNHPPMGGCPGVAGNVRLRSKSESAAAVRDPCAETRDATGVAPCRLLVRGYLTRVVEETRSIGKMAATIG